MHKTIIKTDKAPRAIGPYSQAVKIGNFIFLSGQIPIDPKTGELVNGDIKAQFELVMENIKNILSEAGATLHDVVKATLYLKDIKEFSEINTIYGRFFDSDPPARSTVEVSNLPKGAKFELEVIAYKEGV
ncbi:MAG: RidA family protein [Nitrospirota bacterium]